MFWGEIRNLLPYPLARLGELIEVRNFFAGTNPTAIWNLLAHDPELAVRIEHRTFHGLWIWPITKSHAYLTRALTLRKHRGERS